MVERRPGVRILILTTDDRFAFTPERMLKGEADAKNGRAIPLKKAIDELRIRLQSG